VRYVLEVACARLVAACVLRPNLIDASTGNHLWPIATDGDLTDVFACRMRSPGVVAAIEPKLLEAEGIRSQSRSPEDLDAWDMVMRANSLFGASPGGSRSRDRHSQAAVERFPDYAPAYSMLAFILLCRVMSVATSRSSK